MLVALKNACAELGVSLSHARLGRLVANGKSVDPEKREGGAKQ